jgi:hypothetical protein
MRVALTLCALILFGPAPASAWGYQGHRVVGSIADQLLVNTDAARQVQTILNDGDPHGKLTLRLVGPWPDCVKGVDIPFDLGDAWTRELMTAARAVPASEGGIEDWPANWAGDSVQTARQAFAGLHFQRTDPPPKVKWNVSFEDHTAYLLMAGLTKRRQLAKGGAHLAEILRAIWP